jgi:shikimate kinase
MTAVDRVDGHDSSAPQLTDRRNLVLIGLMGVGKSTVGRHCADRLGRRFVDTDDVVVEFAGMPLVQAFALLGEDRLRDLEQKAVADVVASEEPLVIACGGGTVVRSENRRALQAAGIVIWLRAPTSVLANRVGKGEGRPMLTGKQPDALARLGAEREPVYEAAADAIVEADRGGVEEVADIVLARFEDALRAQDGQVASRDHP